MLNMCSHSILLLGKSDCSAQKNCSCNHPWQLKMWKTLTLFLIFKLHGKFLCVLQNYLALGNLSNLSFLTGAEQLIC